MANGHGGYRAGSGRKPRAVTIARRAIVANKIATAEEAFAFHEAIMHDEDQPTAIRAASASWLYENVMGKPLQMTRNADKDEYDRAQDWRAGKSAEEIAAIEEAARIVNERAKNTPVNVD